jgi:MoaA/NifB/PqqE/SkfB family radical SAM enzyme
VHLEVMPDGDCKPCCVARDAVHEAGRPLTVAERSIQEIRGTHYMRSLRRALASGEKADVCSYCWSQEKRGEYSLRQRWNQNLAGAVKGLGERTGRGVDVSEPLPLQYLQMSMGNKCNLACRMCGPAYSSRIADDPVHRSWAPPVERRVPLWRAGLAALTGRPVARPREAFVPDVPWFEQQEFFRAELVQGGADLRFLYVTGGEPFLNPSFERLVAEYTERGWARNITLSINTNLFHNEARIRAIVGSLLAFGSCTIGASVDGYGPVYEYIRHPGRWDVVERNIRVVRSIAADHGNLALILAIVVQPYNCLSLVDLLRFADDVGIGCYPHMIDGPYYLRIRVVPRDLRRLAADRLRAYAASDPGGSSTATANREHAARLALHLDSIEDDRKTAKERRRFLEFTHALDESRAQRLETAAPELAEALIA